MHKRYGPVGSHYNSKKYLAMHNRNISEGLKRYHRHKNGIYTQEEVTAYMITLMLVAIFLLGALSLVARLSSSQ